MHIQALTTKFSMYYIAIKNRGLP